MTANRTDSSTDRESPGREARGRTDLPLEEFCDNELFDLLGNRRRRYVLCYLVFGTGPIAASDLAERIAEWEAGAAEEVTSSEYQSVYNSLYQTHFPRLEAAGLVEYDRSENLVYPSTQLGEIERFIATVDSSSDDSLPRLLVLASGVVLGGVMTGSLVLLIAGNWYALLAAALVSVGAFVLGGLVT